MTFVYSLEFLIHDGCLPVTTQKHMEIVIDLRPCIFTYHVFFLGELIVKR